MAPDVDLFRHSESCRHIGKEEQLALLLQKVSFDGIDLSRKPDLDELVQLVFSYGDRAQLGFDDFAMEDFMERLAFAECQRWGLVIELLIEALGFALLKGDTMCKIDHFSQAFSNIVSTPLGYSPFTMPNYRDHFDQDKLLEVYEKTRQKKAPKSK